jgi:hypothetical protein
MKIPKQVAEYLDMREKSVSNYWLHHWVKNLVDNWTAIGAYGIPAHTLPFPGVEQVIVCVASGRSLEKDIDKLKEDREGKYIICGPSNLSALLANEIVPDLCLVIDSSEETVNYIRRVNVSDLKGINFLTHPAIHPYFIEYMVRSNLDMYVLKLLIPEANKEFSDNWYNQLVHTFFEPLKVAMAMSSSTGNAQVLTAALFRTLTHNEVDWPVVLLGYDFSSMKDEITHVTKYAYENGKYVSYRDIVARRSEFDLGSLVSFMHLVTDNNIETYDGSTYQHPFSTFVPRIDLSNFKEDRHVEYDFDDLRERFRLSLENDLTINKGESQ